jgi:hypothetical protein
MAPTKRCRECGEDKPLTEFGRNQSLGDGLSFYCLACNRQRNRRWYRDHRRAQGRDVRDHSWIPDGFRWCPTCQQPVAHEDYVRNTRTTSGFGSECKACHRETSSASYFYRRYGLTKRELLVLRAAQDDRCAICGESEPQHLDHDHETGHIRQLLCQRCNQGLGLLQDDPDVLRAAAQYVERHRDHQAAGDRPADSRPARSSSHRRRVRERWQALLEHDAGRVRHPLPPGLLVDD